MIINFNKVILDGFMSFDHAEVDVDNLGIVSIVGENQYEPLAKSNGSGKSAIIESILWCLTSNTSRGSSNVMNSIINKGTYVTVDVDIDDKNYVITRAKNHCDYGNMLRIVRDGEDISGNTLTKSKDVLINELQGKLDYDTLTSIIILSQGLPGRLSVLKPSSRKARLEELSNTDNYLEMLQYKVNSEAQRIQDKVNKYKLEIQSKTSERNAFESQIDRAKASLVELSNNSVVVDPEQYNSSKETLTNTQNKIRELNQELDKVRGEFHRDSSEKTRADILISNTKRECQDLLTLINGLKSAVCPTCHQNITDQSQLDKMKEDNQNLLIQKKKSLSDAFNLSTELDTKIKEYNSKITELLSEIKGSESVVTELSAYIVKCDKQKNSSSIYENTIKDLSEKVEVLNKEIESYSVELSSIESDYEICSYLKSQLSRKFRSFLLEGILAYMNIKCKEYSKYLFSTQGDVSLEINGNNIDIKLGGRNFEDLSGGEGRRVDILLQLVQRDLAKNESGFSSNILVLDEVLDNLDNLGSESVISLLEYKSPDISSMFVVSHKTDLALPFDTKIKVVKNTDQISRIVEVG